MDAQWRWGRHKAGAVCYLRDVMRPAKRAGSSKTSFEALYEGVAERLLLYLARRVRDSDAAAELWAECWAVAFESWPRCPRPGLLKPRRGCSAWRATSWPFTTARGRSSEERSRNSGGRCLRSSRLSVSGSTGSWSSKGSAPLSRTHSPRCRRTPQAVRLRVLEDLPYDAIANRLGCSEQTARAHVSRGLRGLERVLAPDQDGLQPQGGTR